MCYAQLTGLLSSSCPLCWALWLGLVLFLSSSCPRLGRCVRVLSSSCPCLGRATEICGWSLWPGLLERCGRTNSDVNADKISLMKQFAFGAKSIIDSYWSKRIVLNLFGVYACQNYQTRRHVSVKCHCVPVSQACSANLGAKPLGCPDWLNLYLEARNPHLEPSEPSLRTFTWNLCLELFGHLTRNLRLEPQNLRNLDWEPLLGTSEPSLGTSGNLTG